MIPPPAPRHLHAGNQFCVVLFLCASRQLEGPRVVLSLNASTAFICGALSFVFLTELFILELPPRVHTLWGAGGVLPHEAGR